MNKKYHLISVILTLIFILPITVWANHISIDGNVTLTGQSTVGEQSTHYTHLQFDISWDNSWRTSSAPNNWDAAWVFAKWKLHGGTDWAHCTLNTSGHNKGVNPIEIVNPSSDNSQTGVFIYHDNTSLPYSDSNDWNNVKLRWNYGTDGVDDADIVDVKVFAIEMVYIPQGSFSLYNGESADLYSNFNSGNTISSEDALAEGAITWNRGESPWCGAQNIDGTIGGCTELGVNYPKGYKAIYCMKYEISQGQYADFLSLLTDDQDGYRYPNTSSNRHTISGSYGNYTASVADRACNYLQWADGLAYADCAGLRPMTELEFEKICRGPETADTYYAWGDGTIHSSAYTISNDGTATATVDNSTTAGNCSYSTTDGGINGPLRCGIFADAGSNRQESGATYYGVMELSGNLWERCITVAKYCYDGYMWYTTGAGSFDGQHGDGSLTVTGFADVTNWPSPTVTSGDTAYGSSFRGASWENSATKVRVSDRYHAAVPHASRYNSLGFRAVRTQ